MLFNDGREADKIEIVHPVTRAAHGRHLIRDGVATLIVAGAYGPVTSIELITEGDNVNIVPAEVAPGLAVLILDLFPVQSEGMRPHDVGYAQANFRRLGQNQIPCASWRATSGQSVSCHLHLIFKIKFDFGLVDGANRQPASGIGSTQVISEFQHLHDTVTFVNVWNTICRAGGIKPRLRIQSGILEQRRHTKAEAFGLVGQRHGHLHHLQVGHHVAGGICRTGTVGAVLAIVDTHAGHPPHADAPVEVVVGLGGEAYCRYHEGVGIAADKAA